MPVRGRSDAKRLEAVSGDVSLLIKDKNAVKRAGHRRHIIPIRHFSTERWNPIDLDVSESLRFLIVTLVRS